MKTWKAIGHAGMLLAGGLFLVGCATVSKGTTQRIPISSDPPGAQVTIDNISAGETPITIELSCGSQHTVTIQKAGYLPHTETLSQTTSAAIAGNIVAGGLVGLCIDAASGAMYNLTPESISATLVKAAGPPPEQESNTSTAPGTPAAAPRTEAAAGGDVMAPSQQLPAATIHQ